MQVQDALVDAHLPAVEGVGTLTARRLADHKAEDLGGHADGAGDAELLLEGLVLELGADLLEGLHLGGGEGDADAVDGRGLHLSGLSLSETTPTQQLLVQSHEEGGEQKTEREGSRERERK